jgi:predicted RNA-binding protein YlxR (DUF448 family)
MEKFRMTRFVLETDGSWSVDRRNRRPGRGAYLCSAGCQSAVKKNKRYRGLSEVAVADEVWKT